jgi:holo-[acyl-carrier protein] synthase
VPKVNVKASWFKRLVLVIKIGTDICSIARIVSAHKRFGLRFLQRILTPAEIEYVQSNPYNLSGRLAARFAAKEAVSKVLGTGWIGIDWKEIEILSSDSGAPKLELYGRAVKISQDLGLKHWEVSLSHEREYALAFVLAHS